MSTTRYAVHTAKGYIAPKRGEFTVEVVRTFNSRKLATCVAKFELGDVAFCVVELP